jgi:hypothetical protein
VSIDQRHFAVEVGGLLLVDTGRLREGEPEDTRDER